MAREKSQIIQVHAATETKINTENCVTITTTHGESKDTIDSDKAKKMTDDDGSEKDKRKRKKKRKKKEKTNNISNKTDKMVERKPAKLAPLAKPAPKPEPRPETPNRNTGGCFGFISSWIAKKLEKRRMKKRRAIRERFSKSMKTKLREYDHKKSRGGVAFTLELYNRPIGKSILPAIKQKPGPIKLDYERKLINAEMKRKEQLAKKVEFVDAQEERRFENIERKYDNECGFKQKAELTIMAKQGQAMRNKSRLEMHRRCANSLRQATSVMSRAVSIFNVDGDVAKDNNFLD